MATTSCAPAHVEISAAGAALGTFLLSATTVVYVPQLWKLHSRKSSEGVQPLTVVLILMYASTNAASTLGMKWKQFERCVHEGSYCLVEQLDALQVVVSAIGWLSILLSVVVLPPHNTRRWRALAAASALGIALLWAAVCIVSAAEPCGPVAVALARAIGWTSALFVVVAFVPQLHETWKAKSAGSLSLLFVLFQAAGCCLVVSNQVFSAHDPVAVWLPTAVSGCMQVCVFCLASYYECTRRQRRVHATREGLLQASETPVLADASGSSN